jgi:hypothetical protein
MRYGVAAVSLALATPSRKALADEMLLSTAAIQAFISAGVSATNKYTLCWACSSKVLQSAATQHGRVRIDVNVK